MQQDEDIRIKDLPSTSTLATGMMVAVDSETAGTKSFDISTLDAAIGAVDDKVDAVRQVPESAPANAGQVLTVDSSGATGWADVPTELPAGGTTGQVLIMGANSPAWGIAPLVTGSVLSSDSSSITVPNNLFTVVGSTYTDGKNTLTVNISSDGDATNAAFELSPSVDMTLTVARAGTALKYSSDAGNSLTASKYYQVTAVGNCWTMAEFVTQP